MLIARSAQVRPCHKHKCTQLIDLLPMWLSRRVYEPLPQTLQTTVFELLCASRAGSVFSGCLYLDCEHFSALWEDFWMNGVRLTCVAHMQGITDTPVTLRLFSHLHFDLFLSLATPLSKPSHAKRQKTRATLLFVGTRRARRR